MVKSQWQQVIAMVWKDKWEVILAVFGFVTTLVGGRASLWLMVFQVIITLALLADVILHTRKTIRLVKEKRMPVLAIVGRSDEALRSMLGQVKSAMAHYGFNETQFRNEWRIEPSDFVTHQLANLSHKSEDWHALVGQFKAKFSRLDAKFDGQNVIYHLFLQCPVVLGVGLGAAVGRHYKLVVNHFQDGAYYPLKKSETGRKPPPPIQAADLRQRPEAEYQYLQVTEPETELTPEIVVSVHLSDQEPGPEAAKLASQMGLSVVHIAKKQADLLDPEKDWLPVAREVHTEIRRLMSAESRHIRLCLNVPVALGFAIGMALGAQTSISLYHWFREQQAYSLVLALEKV